MIATSSDTNLVPLSNISFAGSGTNRTATIVPASDQVGSATITITVMDEIGQTTSKSFTVSFRPFLEVPVGLTGGSLGPRMA